MKRITLKQREKMSPEEQNYVLDQAHKIANEITDREPLYSLPTIIGRYFHIEEEG